jgi:hypothetical protein
MQVCGAIDAPLEWKWNESDRIKKTVKDFGWITRNDMGRQTAYHESTCASKNAFLLRTHKHRKRAPAQRQQQAIVQ